jgi:peptide/nickel transport system ATP-binding protein
VKLLEVESLITELGEADNWLRAVNGISLAVNAGETYCLVGESGSGKSVTALSIMGLLPADHFRHPDGRVWLHEPGNEGLDLLNASNEQLRSVRGRRIGMIFQEPMTSLNPVLTIGEQLDEVLRIHRPDMNAGARRERILTALAEVLMPPDR